MSSQRNKLGGLGLGVIDAFVVIGVLGFLGAFGCRTYPLLCLWCIGFDEQIITPHACARGKAIGLYVCHCRPH